MGLEKKGMSDRAFVEINEATALLLTVIMGLCFAHNPLLDQAQNAAKIVVAFNGSDHSNCILLNKPRKVG